MQYNKHAQVIDSIRPTDDTIEFLVRGAFEALEISEPKIYNVLGSFDNKTLKLLVGEIFTNSNDGGKPYPVAASFGSSASEKGLSSDLVGKFYTILWLVCSTIFPDGATSGKHDFYNSIKRSEGKARASMEDTSCDVPHKVLMSLLKPNPSEESLLFAKKHFPHTTHFCVANYRFMLGWERFSLPADVAGVKIYWLKDDANSFYVLIPLSAGKDTGGYAAVTSQLPVFTGCKVGVSTSGVLEEIPNLRKEAAIAAGVARQGEVLPLVDNFPGALVYTNPRLAHKLCSSVLYPVIRIEDPSNRETLLRTLQMWYLEGGSAFKAAQKLYCHRNTVLNRIRRIERLTGKSLSNPLDAVEMYLALYAWDFFVRNKR